jgi:hypothetical protein
MLRGWIAGQIEGALPEYVRLASLPGRIMVYHTSGRKTISQYNVTP